MNQNSTNEKDNTFKRHLLGFLKLYAAFLCIYGLLAVNQFALTKDLLGGWAVWVVNLPDAVFFTITGIEVQSHWFNCLAILPITAVVFVFRAAAQKLIENAKKIK